ncbi:MAG: extracellular solute-binding protein [Lachnospiraceae bacterium]|nr:extracellular solute-binding protein [Lachnospiraceae bacterium]
MRRKRSDILRLCAITLTGVTLLSTSGCTSSKETASALDPKNPVTITIWNYYNGDQLTAFEQLIDDFNATAGVEKGIVAVTVSQGDVDTLADSLLDSVAGKAGAQNVPSLASVYSETAYILDQADALIPLDSYFTEEELSAYIPSFLEEGRFDETNALLQFPIAKSTEIFAANKTDWAPFAADTGIALESLNTKEDLTAAAQTYYEWTDAQTPDIPEDGKALYGRDSVGNYLYLGSYQLGHELFQVKDGELTVDMDRDTFKKLWDNYYIPFINGYFGSYATFRSEDAKTGKILALTSSSSGISYIPTAVTLADDTTHDIELYERAALPFADATENAVVQQGANYCLLKSTPAEQEGSVEFLKWLTETDRNLNFAIMSGYSPVTETGNTKEAITEAYSGDTATAKGQNMLNALLLSADAFKNNTAYATKPFHGSKDVRAAMESALNEAATNDRAAVVTAMENGTSRADAVAPFSTDAYFDEWFSKLCDEVNTLVEE